MAVVYVVMEVTESDGPTIYPTTYPTYAAAVAAVKTKWRAMLEEEDALEDVNKPEDSSGVTNLYIEKGNNMYVYKLPVNTAGGRRKAHRRTRRR